MPNRKALIAITSILFLLLGASLGASLATFFFFLNTHVDSLMIFSYLCVLVFIIILIAEAIIFYRYKNILFRNKGVENYEKQD